MSDESEDITIELDDPVIEPVAAFSDESPAAKASAVEKEEKKVITPEEGIEELKAQLAAARERELSEAQARREADRRAHDAERRAVSAQTEKQKGDIDLVANSIERVKSDSVVLKRQLAEARASGDIDAEADIMIQLSKAGHQLSTLELGLEQLKTAPKPRAPTADDGAIDPAETLARQLTPRSASWVRSHPEYARDSVKNQRMLAAHNLTVTDGIEPDTDDYFARIESILGIKPASPSTDTTTQRQTAPPAAPVSRQSTSNGGQKQHVVRLTADEREVADLSGISYEDYAKQKIRMLNEQGRMQ